MNIELMTETDRAAVLDYLLPYEKYCVVLCSQILHGGKSIYIIRGNFGEIHGVFSWWLASSLHHCIPDVNGRNRTELENAFTHFFKEHSVKYIFSIAGEQSATLMLRKILQENFQKEPAHQFDYFLMENGRFDSVKDLKKMNRQLAVVQCTENDIERVYPLQEAFEKEEVVFEDSLFDEEHCRTRFENFVEAGAVYAGKIKNVPLCKLTVSATTKNYAMLGGVFTLPKYRNCGLGKALVNSVTMKMTALGKKCTLFVKTANETAIKLYEQTGFKKFSSFVILYY